MRDDSRPLGQDLRRLADALSRLVRDHVELARAELREELRGYAAGAALGASALPFLLAALLLFDTAVALGLARWLGSPWAFALVGLVNLAVAGILAGLASARLRQRARPLGDTAEELRRSRELAEQIRQEWRSGAQGPLPPPGVRPYPPDGVGLEGNS